MIYFIIIPTIFKPISQIKKRQMYRGLFDGMLQVGLSDMHMTWAPNDIANDFNNDKKGHTTEHP